MCYGAGFLQFFRTLWIKSNNFVAAVAPYLPCIYSMSIERHRVRYENGMIITDIEHTFYRLRPNPFHNDFGFDRHV